MEPVYLDLHIHTYQDANHPDSGYDVALLVQKIKEYNGNSDFLISFTDHNTINKEAYLKAKASGVNLLIGAELHIKNHEDVKAFHCHIYFNLDVTEENIDSLNKILDELYANKMPEKIDSSIPDIQQVINSFDPYEFMLLPHAGQKHAQFNYSLHEGEKVDNAITRSIYYNQFDGFTARENKGLDATRAYFQKLGISEFVNLLTCSDNYFPGRYPEPKANEASVFEPTWMFAQPTFEGVRLSLSESSRLYYQKEKPQIKCEHIGRVTLKNERIDIDVTLSEGLNVVIGGSSSGKTLFVDSLYRHIAGDFATSRYLEKYGVDQMAVDNPSNMHPYYISQNFISENINDNEEKSIDKIEILNGVFPGDENVNRQISNALNSLNTVVSDMLTCVENIERLQRQIKDIPHPGKLITSGKIKKNTYIPLLPSVEETNKTKYEDDIFKKDVEFLRAIEKFVVDNPFVGSVTNEVEHIISVLKKAKEGADTFTQVKDIVLKHKKQLDKNLEELQGINQVRVENKEKLLSYISDYILNLKKFYEKKQLLSSLKCSFNTDVVEAMGHKLSISNNFKFDERILLDTLNHYLNHSFRSMRDVEPENLFSSKFKQRPRVSTFTDLGNKIYSDLAASNTKTYEITSKTGEKFYELSPGWKTAILLDLILGYDGGNAPIIIDQPEDNLAVKYINEDLVKTIKAVKYKKQVILVSHNATIPMMADAQTIILCQNKGNKITIRSASLEGKFGDKKVLDYIAEQTDGGKASIKKRVKKYNLKKFN